MQIPQQSTPITAQLREDSRSPDPALTINFIQKVVFLSPEPKLKAGLEEGGLKAEDSFLPMK